MVDGLVASGAIRSAAVEKAFRRVERHRFVEGFFDDSEEQRRYVAVDPSAPTDEALAAIYSGRALTTRMKDGLPSSSTSMPALMATMLELLELRPGMRVLEIGTGTGYNAALIAEVVGDPKLVVTVDIQDDVASQARSLLAGAGYSQIAVLALDGFFGFPEAAPYDRIVATVGCPDISPHWLDQLAPEGRMLIPLRHRNANPLHQIWRDEVIRGMVVGFSGFMRMEGELHVDDYWSSSRWRPPAEGEEVQEGDALGLDFPSSWLSLSYFLSLRDDRATFWSPSRGFGLTSESGWVEVTREGVRWLGDSRIVDDLRGLYEEWCSLGRPALEDYEVTFRLRGDSGDEPPNKKVFDLERVLFLQHVSVHRH